ncbi:MAG: PIG-L deacetylase family protein [Elusimicrobiaceae bacterium]|jgi:LmbE family N-acetylglucosaminyl deacetylase
MTANKRFLIVAAHPDDEILGCGATAAKLIKQGWTGHTLILGEGVTSRADKRDTGKTAPELAELNTCVKNANRVIGIRNIHTENLPDNRFDSVDLLDVTKIIERIKNEIKPSLVFTHYRNDLNIDHRITFDAVLTATRPMKGEPVREILAFEVLSSTEWNYPLSFSPDVFFAVEKTLKTKLAAMKEYKGELRQYPHPRSLKAIENLAQFHGIRTGLDYAEAFKLVRKLHD